MEQGKVVLNWIVSGGTVLNFDLVWVICNWSETGSCVVEIKCILLVKVFGLVVSFGQHWND